MSAKIHVTAYQSVRYRCKRIMKWILTCI